MPQEQSGVFLRAIWLPGEDLAAENGMFTPKPYSLSFFLRLSLSRGPYWQDRNGKDDRRAHRSCGRS